MPNYPRKETEETYSDDLIKRVEIDMYHLPFRHRRTERIYGRIEILKRWFQVDFPDSKIYLNLDNLTREVVISLPLQAKRLKVREFLRGSPFQLYRMLNKLIRG